MRKKIKILLPGKKQPVDSEASDLSKARDWQPGKRKIVCADLGLTAHLDLGAWHLVPGSRATSGSRGTPILWRVGVALVHGCSLERATLEAQVSCSVLEGPTAPLWGLPFLVSRDLSHGTGFNSRKGQRLVN